MSRYDSDRIIDAEYRDDDSHELMLSASDVIAWLRDNGTTIQPRFLGPGLDAMADYLVSLCLDATRNLIDGSGS